MLKRQESSLSSSRRQASAAATPLQSEVRHARGVGCMSGIFQFFSKYQYQSKRLTFGRKHEKRKPSSSAKGKCSLTKEGKLEEEKLFDAKELTSVVGSRRSSTLPPEIRRLNVAISPEDSRTSSSLVVKLMGLEDFGNAAAKRPEEDSIAEKRRQLLYALEKCNEDLEALKRIITAVQKADVRLPPPQPAVLCDSSGDGNVDSFEVKPCVEECTDLVSEEQNIPVANAEDLTRSPVGGILPAQRKPPACTTKPGKDEPIIVRSSLQLSRQDAVSPPSAMVESVEQACADIAWGEKREVGRIGQVLQDHLCRELIQELVQELNKKSNDSMHHCSLLLPLQASKRRLCF